jgi:hypothetical protein
MVLAALAMPDHKIIVFVEVLRILVGWELKLKVLLTCVVKAAAREASKKGFHVYGRHIQVDWVIENHAIVEALTVPRGDGTSVRVDLNILKVDCELGPRDTLGIQAGI